jgi:hypothetical protein
MKYYPVCTIKEFYVDATTAKAELKNWSNWKLWNRVSTVETNQEGGLSALYFELMESSNIPQIQFASSKESRVDAFVLDGVLLGEQRLKLQWTITIKGENKEQLLISTILLEGEAAALYYEKYGVRLTKLLKMINRDFIQYLNRKYLDKKWFGEDNSLYGYYIR